MYVDGATYMDLLDNNMKTPRAGVITRWSVYVRSLSGTGLYGTVWRGSGLTYTLLGIYRFTPETGQTYPATVQIDISSNPLAVQADDIVGIRWDSLACVPYGSGNPRTAMWHIGGPTPTVGSTKTFEQGDARAYSYAYLLA